MKKLIFLFLFTLFGCDNEPTANEPDLFNEISAALQKAEKETATSPWHKANGNLWDNVTLYYGEGSEKRIVGKAVGFNPERREVLISTDYSVEVKSRDAIINGPWFVKKTDPALKKMEYTELHF